MFYPDLGQRTFEEQKLWDSPNFGGTAKKQFYDRMQKQQAEQNAAQKPTNPATEIGSNLGSNRTVQDAMLRFPPGTKPFVYPLSKPGPWSDWANIFHNKDLGNLPNTSNGFVGYGETFGFGGSESPQASQAPKPNKFGLTRVSPGMYQDSKGNIMTSQDKRFREIMGSQGKPPVKRQPAAVPRQG